MDNISKLLQLEHNCKNCESKNELEYIIVNQTREFVEYKQAILLTKSIDNRLKATAISDVAMVDQTSLHIQYINRVANTIYKKNYQEATLISLDNIQNDQKENLSNKLLWLPLKSIKDGVEVEYYLLLSRDHEYKENDVEIMKHLATSYKYFLYAMRKCSIGTTLQKHNLQKKHIFLSFVVIALIMLIPVRMSILAPFEVEAKEPYIVTSSLNGAIDKIDIKPNQKIKEGTLLVEFKDTDFKNSVEIAKRTLDVAKARLHSVQQISFSNISKSSEISRLQTEVKLKEAELKYALSEYEKTKIYAKKDGIAIIDSPTELEGKPVTIGEKILSIADEKSIEVKIMLPVSEAIYLDGKNSVTLFFDNILIDTWSGKITQISYKPQVTPEGILSYKIIAAFDDIYQNSTIPKIGLRGTAKIYSEYTTIFYYLFRRPITSARQLVAW
jgi:hypothetical protein